MARTQVPDPTLRGDDLSYQGRFDYGGDRYGFQAEHLLVEKNFIPEVGFLRRDNFRRSYARARFSPRPLSLPSIRQFRLEGSYDYIETADLGIVETRQSQLGFSTELENSARFGVSVAENYEFLHREFTPGPDDVIFPVGGYRFFDVEATWSPGTQRRLNGTFAVLAGDYFDGSIRTVAFRRGRMEVTQRLSLEPSVSVNWIDSPYGSFRTDLLVSRVNWTFTPRMFFSGLIQYNSSSNTVSNNLRLRWGVRARQRAVRGLHGGSRDRSPAPGPVLGAAQPRLRRQDESAVPLLGACAAERNAGPVGDRGAPTGRRATRRRPGRQRRQPGRYRWQPGGPRRPSP